MLQGLDLTSIAGCVHLAWSPEIGDPTAAGWLTVAAYAVCAVLAFMVFGRVDNSREKAFWAFTTLAMMFLCVNKQLDLQSLLTAAGRCVSQLQGWYAERRAFQLAFIVGLLICAVIFLGILTWLMRDHLRNNGLALAGLGIVAAFVAVRAVGFHHVDVLINQRFADIRYNVIFELSGLVLIAINAIMRLSAARKKSQRGAV